MQCYDHSAYLTAVPGSSASTSSGFDKELSFLLKTAAMEAIGSEVGLKMRSAIKAKLMELGCYVDDELPDYVMVMVANKRTRSQMEEDLQLFLSNNTEAFVGWLHQVLQKLQEVTINTKLVNPLDSKKIKSKHLDGNITKKEKDKKKNKDKNKTKEKSKLKSKKSKKEKLKKTNDSDTKESERIRPNVPRLLMNLEKESSPSITDVFAGQILKSHGITSNQIISNVEINDIDLSKRKPLKSRFPIIDPATVSQINTEPPQIADKNQVDSFDIPSITEIEKLKSPKADLSENVEPNVSKKLNESSSDSDSEDVINIRTEAEELMEMGINDDNSSNKSEALTPPLTKTVPSKPSNKEPVRAPEPDFPQIELNLPKRPLRERLGTKIDFSNNKRAINANRPYQVNKSNKNNSSDHNSDISSNRLSSKIHYDKFDGKNSFGDFREKVPIKQRLTIRERFNDKNSNAKKRIGSRVVSLPNEPIKNNISVAVASVVRAPPRPQNHGISAAPQLLLRAMADAHKSLLSMPPKVESNIPTKRKEPIRPLRRNINPQKIIIEVPSNNIPTSKRFEKEDSVSDFELDINEESLETDDHRLIRSDADHSSEYVPEPLGNVIDKPKMIDYIPTHITSHKLKKGIGVDKITTASKILNTSNDSPMNNSRKDPQFVVTLDGLDPNVFLEKKLKMIHEDSETEDNSNNLLDTMNATVDLKQNNSDFGKTVTKNIVVTLDENYKKNVTKVIVNNNDNVNATQLTLQKDESLANSCSESAVQPQAQNETDCKVSHKKRKASPIVFNNNETVISKIMIKNDGSKEERSITTNKYDSLPSLPPDKQRTASLSSSARETRCRFFPDCKLGEACEFYHPPTTTTAVSKQTSYCRAFPACTFGNKCAYTHPPCKFNTTCVRKDCPFSHEFKAKISSQSSLALQPVIASRVVPGMNYKSISAGTLPAICKFYPNCINLECQWYHPKPCRFGKNCVNKGECNFYHYDIPSLKWKSSQ